MKPEIYIREFGLKKAKDMVSEAPDEATAFIGAIYLKFTDRHFWIWHGGKRKGDPEKYFYYKKRSVDLTELKRLVESVDQINAFDYGLPDAKDLLCNMKRSKEKYTINFEVPALEKVIHDYESIYGVGK